ncbi:MAG: hypothetical protein ACRYHA_04265 [Janthinobacterium lividum]
MRFDPNRHERVGDSPWDEALARRTIAHIAADAVARFDPATLWPVHPHDLDGQSGPAPALTTLYHGACGV